MDDSGSAAEIERLQKELSAERSRRETLERAHASLLAAFERLEGGVVLIDSEQVLFASSGLTEMFGIPADRLRRMTREQFVRALAGLFDEPPGFLRRIHARGFEGGQEREDVEIQRPSWRRIRCTGRSLQLPGGKGLLAIFTDITQESDLASDRKWQALTDELTGLANRRAGEQAIAREAAQALRAGRPLSFALFDIDHFKSVNDTYGHAMGDLVLREVGRYLSESLRGGDTAVRWGGEEFLVILPDVTLEGVRAFGERVRKTIELIRVGQIGQITISAGTAELAAGEDAEEALARADANLYVAKEQGRNRVV